MWINPVEALPPDAGPEPSFDVADAAPRSWPAILLGATMLALAIAWIGGLAWALAATAPEGALTPLRLLAWIGLGSAPLALLAILALLAFRTGAVEANAFARRARLLHRESDRLAGLLALIDRRIEAATTSLARHGSELATAGADAGERLTASGRQLRAEADAFATVAATLDDATATARADLGVLLADLPDAETRAESLVASLRSMGATASEQAGALAEGVESLAAQARAADQATSIAARGLVAEIERIENAAAAADIRLGDVIARLDGASDSALGSAATTLDSIRGGLADQSAALSAMLAQARATFDQSSDGATRGLARQLDALDQRLDAMNASLRGQETTSRNLLGQLEQAIGALEARFAAMGDTGAAQTADLAEALVALSEHGERVGRTLGQSVASADVLLGRAEALRDALESSGAQLGDAIPNALGRLRLHADQGLQAISATAARTDKLIGDAALLNARLGEGRALIDAHGAAFDRLGTGGEQLLATLAAQLAGLASATARTDDDLRRLAEGASPMLADALARLRAAAADADAAVRAALSGAIPEAAETLAQTASREVTNAMAGVGRTELAQVGVASAQAVEAVRAASERLTRQLLVIAETTQALETRIGAQNVALEAADEASFSRQASLLIEALNSTAIDVARLFSNAPTDTAWAAYLKGDRGVFTRRAVRLLDGGEAKAIGQRYADDQEFHGQVDRYIHDFEALLRRVLSVREGEAMGVTLLSSDMGKLYVALAQAIERLRR